MLKKISVLEICAIIVFFSLIFSNVSSESVLMPGFPHEFWGTVKNQDLENLPDGTIIRAIVGNQTYTTSVIGGNYGFNKDYYPPLETDTSPFYAEDPENNNSGKTICFWVDDVNTSQSIEFVGGGVTRLDLVVNIAEENDDDGSSSNNAGPNNNGYPVADASGPYRARLNQTIIFYGSDSYGDASIVNYTWNFGDGNQSFDINPKYIYKMVGTYNVSLAVRDNAGLENINYTTATIFIDTDQDGWSDDEEDTYDTNASDSTDYPDDFDGDYISDDFDEDDDGDGLSDVLEIALGSNPKNANDVLKVEYMSKNFYFVDITDDEVIDIFYSVESDLTTSLSSTDMKNFSVDIDGDNNFDFVYNSVTGEIKEYSSNSTVASNDLLLYGVIIVALFIILIFLFWKKNKGGK